MTALEVPSNIIKQISDLDKNRNQVVAHLSYCVTFAPAVHPGGAHLWPEEGNVGVHFHWLGR